MVTWHVANVSAGCFDITIATLPDTRKRYHMREMQRDAAHQFWPVDPPDNRILRCWLLPEHPSCAFE